MRPGIREGFYKTLFSNSGFSVFDLVWKYFISEINSFQPGCGGTQQQLERLMEAMEREEEIQIFASIIKKSQKIFHIIIFERLFQSLELGTDSTEILSKSA